jgi:hypothetical protein
VSIPERLLPITVSWIRPGTTTDSYGNTTRDWSDGAATTSPLQVMIEQRRAIEQLDGRDATITTLVLFTNELGVEAIDRFVWDGRTYEADGDPWIVYSPAGPHHSEVAIVRVEG